MITGSLNDLEEAQRAQLRQFVVISLRNYEKAYFAEQYGILGPTGRYASGGVGYSFWSGQWDLSDPASAFTDFPLTLFFEFDLTTGEIIPGSGSAVLRNRTGTLSTAYTNEISGTVAGSLATVIVDWPDGAAFMSDNEKPLKDWWPIPDTTTFELQVGYNCVDISGQRYVCRTMSGTHDAGPAATSIAYGEYVCE